MLPVFDESGSRRPRVPPECRSRAPRRREVGARDRSPSPAGTPRRAGRRGRAAQRATNIPGCVSLLPKSNVFLSSRAGGRTTSTGALAANLAVTVDPAHLGVRGERLDNTLDCLGNEPVVGVQPAEVVAGREREPLVERLGLAAVGLRDDGRPRERASSTVPSVEPPSTTTCSTRRSLRGEGVETARRTGRPGSGTG